MVSSFTIKELLSRCFAKAKVTRYTAQLSSNLQSNYFSEQFHMAASLYISLTHHQKRKTAAQQTIVCSRSTIQKLDKLWNVYKVCNKETGAKSFDAILVLLLLTLIRFHTCSNVPIVGFGKVNAQLVEGLIILFDNYVLPQ